MNLEQLIPTGQKPLPNKTGNTPANQLTADVKDPPRNKSRVRCKVKNRCTATLQIGDATCHPGESEIWVYADEVAKFREALVEDNLAELERARQGYTRHVLGEARDLIGYQGGIDQLMKDIDADLIPDGFLDALKEIKDTDVVTVESVFHDSMKRDIKPLDALEVVEGSEAPEPKVVEQDKERRKLAGAMGESMGAANAELVERVVTKVLEAMARMQNGGGNQNRR